MYIFSSIISFSFDSCNFLVTSTKDKGHSYQTDLRIGAGGTEQLPSVQGTEMKLTMWESIQGDFHT